MYFALSVVIVFCVGFALFLIFDYWRVTDMPVAQAQGEHMMLQVFEGDESDIFEDVQEYDALEPELVFVPNVDFTALREHYGNEDIVGHLWIDGTSIDYFITQTVDNSFYLYHDIWGNRTSAGWVFLDYDVDLNRANHNLVIYGHNMRAGDRFHNIRFYADYDFFRTHNIIHLETEYESTVWEVFAFYVASIDFPYTHINYANDEQWTFMQQAFLDASVHNTGIVLTPSDRVLTLSTCTTDNNPNTRFVLQARLVLP